MLAFGPFALPASAKILIEIDKSAQRMTVSQDGAQLYTWPVSTGLRSYDTPGGAFTPFRMEKEHYSREWDDAPMPHSIFFTQKGHAIHGTEHIRNIGRPASHGCVRLEPENARVLFALVRQEGMANTSVFLVCFITPFSIPHLLALQGWPLVWLAASACALVAMPLLVPRPETAATADQKVAKTALSRST